MNPKCGQCGRATKAEENYKNHQCYQNGQECPEEMDTEEKLKKTDGQFCICYICWYVHS